jgi:hypothetical protein
MDDGDIRYTIAYEEALRAIGDQQAALDVLQARAGTIASAGAIATGLIGLGASDGRGLGIAGFAAIFSCSESWSSPG